MNNFNLDEFELAHKEVESTIKKCEKIHKKFLIGSSQYSLLTNRIKAMYISKLLLENEMIGIEKFTPKNRHEFELKNINDFYTLSDLRDALSPVNSILNKCENAQRKYDINTTQYKRYIKLIISMNVCKALIEK